MASATAKTLKLKLLVDKNRNAVLCAEAPKSFVDFIFHILQLPMGTVVRLISEVHTSGSLGILHNSVETLDDNYFMHSRGKDSLLSVEAPSYGGGAVQTLLLPHATEPPQSYYRCNSGNGACHVYISSSHGRACPGCSGTTTTELIILGTSLCDGYSADGYVKDLVTYMVRDDLFGTPFSSTSIVTLLKRNMMEMSDLEERVVDFGNDEAVKLLRAMLRSTTVLTDIFLCGEKKVHIKHEFA